MLGMRCTVGQSNPYGNIGSVTTKAILSRLHPFPACVVMSIHEGYRYSVLTLEGETSGFLMSSAWPLRLGEIHVRLCDQLCNGDTSKCHLVWKEYCASENVSIRKTVLVDEVDPVLNVVWAAPEIVAHGHD